MILITDVSVSLSPTPFSKIKKNMYFLKEKKTKIQVGCFVSDQLCSMRQPM